MDPTQGITKRLSFGEVSQHLNATQKLDVEDVIKALHNPSVENYQAYVAPRRARLRAHRIASHRIAALQPPDCSLTPARAARPPPSRRALSLLESGYQQRFELIQTTAKEQSAAVGDADLRRLKRQFSSLKNTFLHYEVKDEFIAAVADGLPNGTEEIQLAQFEEELARNVAALRGLKARNEAATGEIGELIAQIVEVLGGVGRTRDATGAALAALRLEQQRAAAEAAAMPPPPGDGPDEAACHAALAAAAAETRELEARIAASSSEASESEAALVGERQEAGLARDRLDDLRAQDAARGERAAGGERFAQAEAWAEEAAALLGALGGVTLLRCAPDGLVANLATAYPTAAVAGGRVGAVAAGEHRLELRLEGGGVAGATLEPAEVEVGDLVEAAQAGGRGADFVVRACAGAAWWWWSHAAPR
jgi:hypothetical protein